MEAEELNILTERYMTGEATEAERQRLLTWYERRFDEAPDTFFNRTGTEAPGARIMENIRKKIPEIIRQPDAGRSMRYRKDWFVAAALAALLGIAGFWGSKHINFSGIRPLQYVRISNPGKQIRNFYLPDSSRVWLNTGSSLEFPDRFDGKRQVELNGEAYFDVRKDTENPFIIKSGKLETVVLGTSFNIRAYPADEHFDVTVENGKVAVGDGKAPLAFLTPGLQLSYHVVSGRAIIRKADLRSVLAWRSGELRFGGMRLKDIAAVLQRNYSVKIVLDEAGLGDLTYSAAFANGVSLDDVMMMLCSVDRLNYKYSADKSVITLSRNKSN